jgi:hypothetical protein
MTKAHIYFDFACADADTKRRNDFARSTRPEWSHQSIPVTEADLPRKFDDGDRWLCYLKDVVDIGLQNNPCDLEVLTNADVCFAPCLDDQLDTGWAVGERLFHAHRREYPRIDKPLTDDEVCRGELYPGVDLFAFTPDWWKENRDQMPDMVLGGEAWDLVLRELQRRTSTKPGHFVRHFTGIIYHERHSSIWCRPEHIKTLPCQHHNVPLAAAFVKGQPELEALLTNL